MIIVCIPSLYSVSGTVYAPAKRGLLEFGQEIVTAPNTIEVNLMRITRPFYTSLEPDTIDAAVGSKSELELFAPFPPMGFVTGIRIDKDCFVPIPRFEVTILIPDRIVMHSRIMVAWTAWLLPSGKAKNANRLSAALVVVVNVETNTGAGIFVVSSRSTVWRSDHKRWDVIGVLLELLVVVSACELQRARLNKDLDIFATVEFEIPALLPVLVIRARIIRVSAGAGDPRGS
jgi:hypothetical protein